MQVKQKFKYNRYGLLDREHQAYEHFKLLWMLERGYNIHNMFSTIRDYLKSYSEEYADRFDEAFETFEMNIGFGGELWPCFDEFMDCEYHECGYDKEDV